MNEIHSFFCGKFVALDMISYQYELDNSDEFDIIENGDE